MPMLSRVLLFVTPWTPPGSSVHGISQARILEWVPFPPQGDLPNPGAKLLSPSVTVSLPLSHQGSSFDNQTGTYLSKTNVFIQIWDKYDEW